MKDYIFLLLSICIFTIQFNAQEFIISKAYLDKDIDLTKEDRSRIKKGNGDISSMEVLSQDEKILIQFNQPYGMNFGIELDTSLSILKKIKATHKQLGGFGSFTPNIKIDSMNIAFRVYCVPIKKIYPKAKNSYGKIIKELYLNGTEIKLDNYVLMSYYGQKIDDKIMVTGQCINEKDIYNSFRSPHSVYSAFYCLEYDYKSQEIKSIEIFNFPEESRKNMGKNPKTGQYYNSGHAKPLKIIKTQNGYSAFYQYVLTVNIAAEGAHPLYVTEHMKGLIIDFKTKTHKIIYPKKSFYKQGSFFVFWNGKEIILFKALSNQSKGFYTAKYLEGKIEEKIIPNEFGIKVNPDMVDIYFDEKDKKKKLIFLSKVKSLNDNYHFIQLHW